MLGRVADEVFDEPIDALRVAAMLAEPGHILLVVTKDRLLVSILQTPVRRYREAGEKAPGGR